MIKELGWYLADNRFSSLAAELDGSVRAYGEAKASGKDEPELGPLREAARKQFEEQCVKAGLRDEKAPYVNIDAEFFEGNSLDEGALDTFIKEILKGHGYQRILWTYMGTTGNFTVISKAEMAHNGQQYEDYLPLEYKKSHPVKKPLEGKLGENTVPLYVYGDGSISSEYDAKKAKLEFNRLKDKSGIDWKQGYDPNGEVKKDGWHGEFDKEGTWVRVPDKKESTRVEAKTAIRRIELIKAGETAILYDPGNALVSGEGTAYVTEQGEPYGALELDDNGTVEAIDRQLKELGVKEISGIAAFGGAGQLEQYKNLLGERVAADLHMVDRETLRTIKAERQIRAEAERTERAGVVLERKIRIAGEQGAAGSELEQALRAGSVEVPLSPMKREDATVLGLTEAEQENITTYAPADKARYAAILSNLFASWDVYAAGGKTKPELAKLAAETLEGKGSEAELRAAVSLGSIIKGSKEPETGKDKEVHLVRTGIPGVFTEVDPVDFFEPEARTAYLRQLEKKRIVPKGGAEAAEVALVKNLPAINTEQKAAMNRGLTRTLSQYKEIAASTGIPLGEVVGAVAAQVNGEAVPALQKQVYYELPAGKVCREAGKQNLQTRNIPLDSRTEEVDVVIGGVGGVGLNEVGFDRQTLETEYGYTDRDAKEAETFLRGIRAASPAMATGIAGELGGIVRKQAGKGAKGLRSGVLDVLDSRPGTAYHVGSESGWRAYRESPRYSGLSENAIAGLLAESWETDGRKALPGVVAITPRYRSAVGAVALVRSGPRGIPERVMPAALFRKGSAPEIPAIRMAELGKSMSADVAKTTSAAPSVPTVSATVEPPVPAVSAGNERREVRRSGRDRELERLRKIEANYEKDKAQLAREKAPALARSESHDIGHAEGSEDVVVDIEKFVQEHIREVKQKVKRG